MRKVVIKGGPSPGTIRLTVDGSEVKGIHSVRIYINDQGLLAVDFSIRGAQVDVAVEGEANL